MCEGAERVVGFKFEAINASLVWGGPFLEKQTRAAAHPPECTRGPVPLAWNALLVGEDGAVVVAGVVFGMCRGGHWELVTDF